METHNGGDHTRDPGQAREALESIDSTRRATARSAASPHGYYALVGFGEGLLIASVAGGHSIRYLGFAVGIGMVLGGMWWYTKHTGVVTWANLSKPFAWPAWIMVAVALGALIIAVTFAQPWGIIGGLVTFITWAVLGPIFDRAWVRSNEKQP